MRHRHLTIIKDCSNARVLIEKAETIQLADPSFQASRAYTIELFEPPTTLDPEVGSRQREERLSALWRELVYCILAGGPIPAEAARISYLWLFWALPECSVPRTLLSHMEGSLESITLCLTDAGHRFSETKARSILSAAMTFTACETILLQAKTTEEARVLRVILTNLTWGIGPKIASHWLRNSGWDLPVIDIHVRRFLSSHGFVDEGSRTWVHYQEAEDEIVRLARTLGVNPGLLDFHIWHHQRRDCESLPTACYVCTTWREELWKG